MGTSGVPWVLVVDDDPATRAIVGIALRRAGFAVRTEGSAEDALASLAARPFHWLVTDIGMWPVDGYELAERARALRPEIGVVFITALPEEARPSRRVEGLLLTKPLDEEKLIAALGGRPRSVR